jgi:hypothetical protein
MRICFKYKEKSVFLTILFVTCLLFLGCGKSTSISGHFYSKHYYPLPNANVYVDGYDGVGGKKMENIRMTTDNNGAFMKTVSLNKKSSHFVVTAFSNDSGGCVLDDQKINDLKNLTLKIQ